MSNYKYEIYLMTKLDKCSYFFFQDKSFHFADFWLHFVKSTCSQINMFPVIVFFDFLNIFHDWTINLIFQTWGKLFNDVRFVSISYSFFSEETKNQSKKNNSVFLFKIKWYCIVNNRNVHEKQVFVEYSIWIEVFV